jgi:hypothetical protein
MTLLFVSRLFCCYNGERAQSIARKSIEPFIDLIAKRNLVFPATPPITFHVTKMSYRHSA